MLFGDSVVKRAKETRVAERTLYRRVSSFEAEGMESLFDAEMAMPRQLPPAVRRLIVDLKAEHPALNLSEISRIWLRPLRQAPRREDGQARARGGARAPADDPPLPALPRDP